MTKDKGWKIQEGASDHQANIFYNSEYRNTKADDNAS